MKKVIVITGPTAIGKTKISIEVAKILNTSIINGDSYQAYTNLPILTAKPTHENLKEITHYLMDEIDPFLDFTIYDYQKRVRKYVDNIDIPLIVGGSGLYIDSVIYDYQFNESLNKLPDYSKYTSEELHEKLKLIDPINAKKIHPNNRKRLERAIFLANNQSIASRNNKHEYYYKPLIICLSQDRDILYQRINKRTIEMIDNGLIEEVKNSPDFTSTLLGKAIGYLDTKRYLNGEITKDALIEKIQKDSRHYAKRQLTWYRNHLDVVMVDVDLNNINNTIKEIVTLINTFLN